MGSVQSSHFTMWLNVKDSNSFQMQCNRHIPFKDSLQLALKQSSFWLHQLEIANPGLRWCIWCCCICRLVSVSVTCAVKVDRSPAQRVNRKCEKVWVNYKWNTCEKWSLSSPSVEHRENSQKAPATVVLLFMLRCKSTTICLFFCLLMPFLFCKETLSTATNFQWAIILQ